jgi:hypothetical protein
MLLSESKVAAYSCIVFIAVAGILASGDTTLAQNQQGQGPSRVIVTNTPLPVTVTNQPAPAAVTPFQGQCTLSLTNVVSSGCDITPKPAKQLVVQAVSVNVIVPVPATPFVAQIKQVNNVNSASSLSHYIPLLFQGQNGVNNSFVGLQPLTWIFDPTSSGVQCLLQLPGMVTGGQLSCTVTGYLQ